MGSFLGALGNAAMNGLTGGVTGAIGSIMGGIGKLFKGNSDKKAEERQFNRTKELMKIQNQYNKEAAAQSQKYNEQMWNYTNYENQVAHIKNAGLNPGLLYGMSGGGGISSGGATQEGVSGVGQDQSVIMGINMRQMEANTKLAEAEANKANAEAAKISGVDTKNTEANTELARAQKKLAEAKKMTEKTIQDLNKAETDVAWVKQEETAASAQSLWAASQDYLASARKKGLEGDITEQVKDDIIAAYRLKNLEIWSEFLLNNEKINTNKAEQAKLYSDVRRVQNEAEYWNGLIEIGKELNKIKSKGNEIKKEEVEAFKEKAESLANFLDKKCSYLGQENARAWIKSATTILDSLGDNFEKVIGVMGKMGKLGKMLTKQTEKTKTKMNKDQTKEIINEWNVIGW